MRRTIFERYGGFASVSRVVMSFYEKMVSSPLTSPFFANTDMKKLIDHQTKFMSAVMGGPASYTNEHIERVHAKLGITESAFHESMELLTETLEDHDFEDEDIQHIEDDLMSRKNFIVTRD
jgi:hemoglobin